MNDSVNNSKNVLDKELQEAELIAELDEINDINEAIEVEAQSLIDVDEQVLAEIEAIQDAIEGNDELIDDVETAAGDAGDGGRSFAVELEREGLETIASSNYQTALILLLYT